MRLSHLCLGQWVLWSRLEKDSATASSVEVAGTWSKTSGMTAAVVLATLIPMLNVGPCYDYDDSEELFGLEMAVEGPLGWEDEARHGSLRFWISARPAHQYLSHYKPRKVLSLRLGSEPFSSNMRSRREFLYRSIRHSSAADR